VIAPLSIVPAKVAFVSWSNLNASSKVGLFCETLKDSPVLESESPNISLLATIEAPVRLSPAESFPANLNSIPMPDDVVWFTVLPTSIPATVKGK